MSKLPIDFKIDKIIKQIQADFKAKNIEIEYDTIVAVIESQLRETQNGMRDGHTVVWKFFGTFVATKKRVDMLNKMYAKKGFSPKLQDTGLVRMSFTSNGVQRAESALESTSKKDIV